MSELVIDCDDKLWVRGLNNRGQLGEWKNICGESYINSFEYRMSEIKYVSCYGCHSMVVTNEGKLLSSGSGDCGQLGDGKKRKNDFAPIHEYGYDFKWSNEKFIKAFCGHDKTYALNDSGNIWVTGGSVNYGDNKYRTHFEKIKSLENIVDFSQGCNYCYAVDNDGFIWKSNKMNSVETLETHLFEKINDYQSFVSVCCVNKFVCVLDINGKIWVCDSSIDSTKFHKILTTQTFKQISGHEYFIALDTEGKGWTCNIHNINLFDFFEITTLLEHPFSSLSCSKNVILALDVKGYVWSSNRTPNDEFSRKNNMLHLHNIKNVKSLVNEKPILYLK